jgi:hypothetical protein
MKVSELIEQLKLAPQDAEVVLEAVPPRQARQHQQGQGRSRWPIKDVNYNLTEGTVNLRRGIRVDV